MYAKRTYFLNNQQLILPIAILAQASINWAGKINEGIKIYKYSNNWEKYSQYFHSAPLTDVSSLEATVIPTAVSTALPASISQPPPLGG